MEIEGLKKCLEEVISDRKLNVTKFVSDRHVQIRKYMRETYGSQRKERQNPHILHQFDIWHIAKSKI